jgi:glycolate oxidase iron-sulfur subunit
MTAQPRDGSPEAATASPLDPTGELRGVVEDCVHCGFCLPACPTYQLWGEEMDSPRGRIHLIAQMLDGAQASPTAAVHVDRCLGCMACVPACPSGVRYDALIEAARSWIEEPPVGPRALPPRSIRDRAIRAAIFETFPYPRRLRLLIGPLRAAQRTGLERVLERSGLLDRLSPELAAALRVAPARSARQKSHPQPTDSSSSLDSSPAPASLIPDSSQDSGRYASNAFHEPGTSGRRWPGASALGLFWPRGRDNGSSGSARGARGSRSGTSRGLPERVPAQGTRRAVVGMLTGCVQQVFFPRVNAATARVLAAEGCDVVIPAGQGCCGALSLHGGRKQEATRFARRTIETFERAGVDAIVINAAGCGSAMKEYAGLLAGDAAWSGRAAAMSAKVRDLTEYLAELGPAASRHPLPVNVAYHDACHLAHAQRITTQPRELLQAIPGLELTEIADAGTCCGSAGIYNLVQPAAARQLGERKAAAVLDTGADLLVSANPGCAMQITAALTARGRRMPMVHIAEVLDASIRGAAAADLRGEA